MSKDPGLTLDWVLRARELLKEAQSVLDHAASVQGEGEMLTDSESPLHQARVTAERARTFIDQWLDQLTLGEGH